MEPCRTVIYSAFVMSRSPFLHQPVPSSQIWLYYASKMVTVSAMTPLYSQNKYSLLKLVYDSKLYTQVFEERPGYDFSQFVADMGGSLGFLLGLSVLGLIGILEKVSEITFSCKRIYIVFIIISSIDNSCVIQKLYSEAASYSRRTS